LFNVLFQYIGEFGQAFGRQRISPGLVGELKVRIAAGCPEPDANAFSRLPKPRFDQLLDGFLGLLLAHLR
jgi:hypothetical protein